MRVAFWEFHCPSICVPKKSIQYRSPRPLNPEGVHLASCIPSSDPSVLEEKNKTFDDKVAAEKKALGYGNADCVLRSSLKKPRDSDSKENRKGNVKWMDLLGKELVEVREFESTGSWDSDDNVGKATCLCVVM